MSKLLRYPTYYAIVRVLETVFPGEKLEISLLGSGANSVAWSAVSDTRSIVIRAMPAENASHASYDTEFAVTKLLFDKGSPVPEPIACSSGQHAVDIPDIAFPWLISSRMQGKPLQHQALQASDAEKIGEFLADLHAIPVQGYGKLHLNGSNFHGKQDTAREGFIEYWHSYRLWGIYPDFALETTILATMFPAYLQELKALDQQVYHAVTYGKAVICHNDLHSDHIFLQNGRFSGVIDFGEVCILPRAWDFAMTARYTGWDAIDHMLETYTSSTSEREKLIQQVEFLALIPGVFKLQRQFLRGAPVITRARSLQFIRQTLDRIKQRS